MTCPKFWGPLPEVTDFMRKKCKGQRVLEIGPGPKPFSDAAHFVDWHANSKVPAERLSKVDLNDEPLPFEDKSFDFIYCRHVIEDMAYPFPLIKEISRVGRAGYLETPSPISELTRGVDGGSPPWRGYQHHRWIIWSEKGKLNLIAKLPMIETMQFDSNEWEWRDRLHESKYWNTFLLWDGSVEFMQWRHEHEFFIPLNYQDRLLAAASSSIKEADEFWNMICE